MGSPGGAETDAVRTDAQPPSGPAGPLDALRGITYVLVLYSLMLVMGVICFIPSMLSRKWAVASMKAYCAASLWSLRVIAGTRVEFRGAIPTGPCIIASKHQSFLDILMLTRVLPWPAFVMKKSIRWVPVLGVYAKRLGSIPIDRQAGREATRTLLHGAREQAADRQLIIFPQGTRVPPGADVRWRTGVVRLYQQTGHPLVLVALNTGWYWPRKGIRRSRGTVVLEFVETIPADQSTDGLLEEIADKIEAASDQLAEEAANELRGNGLIP